MAKRKWSTDRIVSFSAIMISLVTLIVFIYQTQLMAEQQRLSVLPHISFGYMNTGGSNFTVYISNDGIGPAFIEDIRIYYQDSVYHKDLPTFLYQDVPEMDSLENIRHSNIIEGQLIPAGRRIDVLQVNDSFENGQRLYALLNKLNVRAELEYRSAYNERWLLSTDHYVPVLIED